MIFFFHDSFIEFKILYLKHKSFFTSDTFYQFLISFFYHSIPTGHSQTHTHTCH